MSNGNWYDEDFEDKFFAQQKVVNKWEEEETEDGVKDNWDDDNEKEEDTKKEPEIVVKAIQVKKKSKLKEKVKKLKEDKVKTELQSSTTDEIHQQKRKREQLQQESDLQLAKEALGLDESKNNIDSMEPSNRDEFNALGKSLVDKLSKYEKSVHYIGFLEEFFRDLCLDAANIKKLNSTLNAVTVEKAKAAKMTKKKGVSKKTSLTVGKGSKFDVMDDYRYDGDELDDNM